jgi:hypothetical protein
MSKHGPFTSLRAEALAERPGSATPTAAASEPSRMKLHGPSHALFRAVWYAGNILLIFAILLAGYSAVWEYSTRKYLKGFSDAIVPASASTEGKIEAILRWMSEGPARQPAGPDPSSPDRDPIDTLNYASLLQICGSATNAFVNLADSAGLPVRRLLLLNSRRMATHVVAEVLIDGRWIVVDPAFRTIPRGPDGGLLTREQLTDPAVFSSATGSIPGYKPEYTFDRTVHVRIARLGIIARPLRDALNLVLPGWEDSTALSLLMERESLATMVAALVLVFFLGLLRVGLRWYGEKRLGVRPVRIRQQVRRAFHAFVDTAG